MPVSFSGRNTTIVSMNFNRLLKKTKKTKIGILNKTIIIFPCDDVLYTIQSNI